MIARTHWTRFRGLMAMDGSRFRKGQGLWISPSRGVHTFAMRFAIDVVYLNQERVVIHLEEELKPWRMAAIRIQSQSILELPVGTIRESQTTLGDQVDIFLERPIHTEAA